MTQANINNAMILSPINANQMSAFQQPTTVDQVLGAATSEDILSVLRQGVKDDLTQRRNEISVRLSRAEGKITEVRTQYDALGPAGIAEIDTEAATQIAAMITKNGFGKAKVEVTFGGRDEAKKIHTYTLKITDPGETSSYSSAIMEKDITVPFSTEAKKLHKQIVDMIKAKQEIEKELMEVKKSFANIDEHMAAARAELGRKRINKLDGGAELLASLTKKKPIVVETVA